MSKKHLQKRYEKLLKDYQDGHTKLESLKKEMVEIRKQIKAAPELSEERPDEILLKA